jgi:hypothetical protein
VITRGMLLPNSTLAFLVAASATILLHETSHAVAGITLGAHAIQSPFDVEYRLDLTSNQQVITALTGPIFSLVTGLCFLVGIGGLFLIAWRFSRFVVTFSRDVGDERAICMWPWIYGTVGLTALMAVCVALTPGVSPAAVVAVMAGAASIGVFAPMSMMFSKQPVATSALAVPAPPRAGLVVLAVLIVLNLALTRQLRWG